MRRSDHSFGGVLPAASVCLTVGYLETSETRRPRLELGCYVTNNKNNEMKSILIIKPTRCTNFSNLFLE